MPRVLNRTKDHVGRDAVYVDRSTIWGNPYSGLDRATNIQRYRTWLLNQPKLVERARRELRGHDLVCWCAPLPCHADILLEVANSDTEIVSDKPVVERAAEPIARPVVTTTQNPITTIVEPTKTERVVEDRPPKVLNKSRDYIGSDAVYVGRPSPWDSPFRGQTRDINVTRHREWLLSRPDIIEKVRRELRGKDLVCWCAPLPCHADTLLEIANSDEDLTPADQSAPAKHDVPLMTRVVPQSQTPIVTEIEREPAAEDAQERTGPPRVLNQKLDKIPSDAVYVGTGTKWSNPWRGQSKRVSIERYREWLPTQRELVAAAKAELRGKDLVCWCAPFPCHADVLIEIANQEDFNG
jgi:hypothetical protein